MLCAALTAVRKTALSTAAPYVANALMNANLSGQGPVAAPKSIPKAPASPKKTTKAKSRTNAKAVDVLIGDRWKTYGSISQAAKAIGTKLHHLSHALLTGKACNGHQVRYATDGQEQPEPDAEPDELPHRDI